MIGPASQVALLHAFTAAQIATSISLAECVEYRGDPKEAYDRLIVGRFDQAPVIDLGHVVGWVATVDLLSAPKVKSVLKPLAASAIVSEDASIADVLQLLASKGFVFIVDQQGLEGFVTPSDLERHAARSHFYLLIAGIEMLLAQIITDRVDRSTILARLREDSRERWQLDVAVNGETNPAEYLYLQDLAELFLSLPEATDREGSADVTPTLTEVCHFRPSVMHTNRPLIKGRNAAELASLARRAETLTAMLTELAMTPMETMNR